MLNIIYSLLIFVFTCCSTQAGQVVVQSGTGSGGDCSSGYVRNSEWLEMPIISDTDQVINGLVAVDDDANNYIAFSVSGAYTVDWGDGSATEDIASGVVAEHNYDFADLSAGTTTADGYRQAIIVVIMQSSQTLTAIDLDERHSSVGNEQWQLGWLDLEISGPSITSFAIQSDEAPSLRLLEISILSNSITDFSNMFRYCSSLQTIPLLDTSAGTNFSNMFYSCSSLQSIPLLDTSAGTDFLYMFYSCSSLQIAALSGTSLDFVYPGSYITTLAIVDIFNGLATVTAQTITITGNIGVAGLSAANRLIATDKGWTIVE